MCKSVCRCVCERGVCVCLCLHVCECVCTPDVCVLEGSLTVCVTYREFLCKQLVKGHWLWWCQPHCYISSGHQNHVYHTHTHTHTHTNTHTQTASTRHVNSCPLSPHMVKRPLGLMSTPWPLINSLSHSLKHTHTHSLSLSPLCWPLYQPSTCPMLQNMLCSVC